LAKKAAETIALVVDGEGAEILLSKLLKGATDSQVISLRWEICLFILKDFVPYLGDGCDASLILVSMTYKVLVSIDIQTNIIQS
jgi:hypothetical protein